jgi:molybdenum cofactor guanylyltransferase
MIVLGVIVAGGESRRMAGSEKAFLTLGHQPLIGHVLARLSPQVDEVVINANGDAARFAAFDCPVIADPETPLGSPLRGLLAGLRHGAEKGYDAVVTVPSDTPFLPLDLVAKLSTPGFGRLPTVATSAAQTHYLTGYWPVSLLADLETAMFQHGIVRLQDWCRRIAAETIAWPVQGFDPFYNINTPAELAAATMHHEALQ